MELLELLEDKSHAPSAALSPGSPASLPPPPPLPLVASDHHKQPRLGRGEAGRPAATRRRVCDGAPAFQSVTGSDGLALRSSPLSLSPSHHFPHLSPKALVVRPCLALPRTSASSSSVLAPSPRPTLASPARAWSSARPTSTTASTCATSPTSATSRSTRGSSRATRSRSRSSLRRRAPPSPRARPAPRPTRPPAAFLRRRLAPTSARSTTTATRSSRAACSPRSA